MTEPVPGTTRARLLAVIAAVLVLAFLKWSHVATMPLAFAVFLIALAWPLQERLEARVPRWAAFTVTVLVLLLLLGGFIGALVWGGRAVAERAPEYADRVQALYGQLAERARTAGIPLPAGGAGSLLGGGLARSAAAALASSVSLILLVVALVILGLIEVHDFRAKALRAFRHPERGEGLVAAVREIVAKYQRYLLARIVAALIQGVTYWLFALLVGLDFAFVWALMAFLLNFIPTLGSIVAVVPPTLFALVQFDGFGRPLLVFAGLAVLQIVCGNYIDPLIQGRYLQLSPVVVLISVVFWGWIWGIGGALLGVPLTVGLVIAADHFPNTRWIARMLAEHRPEEG